MTLPVIRNLFELSLKVKNTISLPKHDKKVPLNHNHDDSNDVWCQMSLIKNEHTNKQAPKDTKQVTKTNQKIPNELRGENWDYTTRFTFVVRSGSWSERFRCHSNAMRRKSHIMSQNTTYPSRQNKLTTNTNKYSDVKGKTSNLTLTIFSVTHRWVSLSKPNQIIWGCYGNMTRWLIVMGCITVKYTDFIRCY